MSDHIPPELISKILARLPIKDVLRFRHVSKSWYKLITSPSFINLHLNSSIANTESRVILRLTIENDGDKQHYYLHHDNQSFDEIEELEPPGNPNSNIGIYGSSNGVFCCSCNERIKTIYGERLILWNPSLGISLILPKSRDGKPSKNRQQHNVGFGFLPSTTDFKIVRVIYARTSNFKCVVPPEAAEIYESYTGSWRDLNASELSYALRDECGHALLKGIVHWTASDPHGVEGSSTYRGLIVTFDLTSEKFGNLLLPKCLQNDEELWYFCVFTMRECLYLMLSGEGSSIYKMKEYGVVDSWEKMFEIEFLDLKTLCLRENGEILMAKLIDVIMDKYCLVSCDRKTNEMMDLGVYHEDGLYYHGAYAYVDSLFLIEDSNESSGKFQEI